MRTQAIMQALISEGVDVEYVEVLPDGTERVTYPLREHQARLFDSPAPMPGQVEMPGDFDG